MSEGFVVFLSHFHIINLSLFFGSLIPYYTREQKRKSDCYLCLLVSHADVRAIKPFGGHNCYQYSTELTPRVVLKGSTMVETKNVSTKINLSLFFGPLILYYAMEQKEKPSATLVC